jgi:putative hemolysin
MKKKLVLIIALIVFSLLILGGAVYIALNFNRLFGGQTSVNSFEECAAKGYPLMESNPRQCRDPVTGKSYTENVGQACQDNCGNGVCEEVVCQAAGSPCAESQTSCPADCGSADQTGLANPASTNCEDKGGTVEIRTDISTQGQVGYCVFPDSTECEEFAFLRNECAKGQCKRECKNVGTKSEGLYNSCTGDLIEWVKCQ